MVDDPAMMAPAMIKNTMKSTPMTMQLGNTKEMQKRKTKKSQNLLLQFHSDAPRNSRSPKMLLIRLTWIRK